jgi:hypothetical protein
MLHTFAGTRVDPPPANDETKVLTRGYNQAAAG